MLVKIVFVFGVVALCGAAPQHEARSSQSIIHEYQPRKAQPPPPPHAYAPRPAALAPVAYAAYPAPAPQYKALIKAAPKYQDEEYGHPAYEFHYSVADHETGDNHGQSESRDGDNTKGEYYLLQPDGQVRKVTYSVDKHSGFVAAVSYSHESPRH